MWLENTCISRKNYQGKQSNGPPRREVSKQQEKHIGVRVQSRKPQLTVFWHGQLPFQAFSFVTKVQIISSPYYLFLPAFPLPTPHTAIGMAPDWSKAIRLIPPCFPPWLVEHIIGLGQWAHGISLVTQVGSEVAQSSQSSRCCLMTVAQGSLLSTGHEIAVRHHCVIMMGPPPECS